MGSPAVLFVGLVVVVAMVGVGEGAMWCTARGGGNPAALQAAMDYACGPGGADCAPIKPSGLCFLPNTLSAHASYAFNSYFQRSNAAPRACDFAGVATVTASDPSSVMGPARSLHLRGGSTNTPKIYTPPPPAGLGGGFGGLNPPGFGSTVPNVDISASSSLPPPPLVLLLPTCLCLILMFV